MWMIWLTVAAVLLAAEILTTGFLLFWFSMGALIVMVLSFFVQNTIIQFILFIIISTLLTFLTKLFSKKIKSKQGEDESFNAKSVIGQKGIVEKEILKNKVGVVRINGETWTAIADENIQEGTSVLAQEIVGVKIKVKRAEDKDMK